jgi:Sec-independent protein translocase protein TatA
LIGIVFGCSVFLFILIWILILRFTQKITYPIQQLTNLTEEIKEATGRDSREEVLSKIENNKIFEDIKKQMD